MKKILIATDGSPSAREAVGVGVELAAEHGAEITFVHVLPADEFIVAGRLGSLPKAHRVDMDESELVLRDAGDVAEDADVPYTLERISGNTIDEIVAVADSLDAEMIVIGSRGHGPLTAKILGSVSQGVLAETRRPVLVVRGVNDREPAAA
ncbi:MAG TPA: universal stress protein [Gaiellaceae bacterium]|jgi:nucleotide-binding universal stress UspA family protein|nr:universal stress protein [Gaiellaceae bacterium]